MKPPLDTAYPDNYHDSYSKTVFGFWLYLLTDFVLFATILAVYFVLRNSTFGGINASELLPLSYTFVQTLLLLLAAFSAGMGGVMAHRKRMKGVFISFSLTFVLGALFFAMMLNGFSDLVQSGNGWDRSAFLSAYFTLLGTFAAHFIFALLWTIVLVHLAYRNGFDAVSLQRFTCLKLFWQFLNLIWVGIVTMVYLMGVS